MLTKPLTIQFCLFITFAVHSNINAHQLSPTESNTQFCLQKTVILNKSDLGIEDKWKDKANEIKTKLNEKILHCQAAFSEVNQNKELTNKITQQLLANKRFIKNTAIKYGTQTNSLKTESNKAMRDVLSNIEDSVTDAVNDVLSIELTGLETLSLRKILEAQQIKKEGSDKPSERTESVASTETKEACERSDVVINLLRQRKDKLTELGSPMSLASYELVIDILEGIAKSTRASQDQMTEIARAINAINYTIPNDASMDEFKQAIADVTKKLSQQSRRSSLFLNANLTRLIKCQGPTLVLDLTELASKYAQYRDGKTGTYYDINQSKKDYLNSLGNLAEHYVSAKQFYFGVGASYAYIPSINSVNNFDLDFSPFNSSIGNNGAQFNQNSGRFITQTNFSNASYPALRLTAETKFFAVDVMLTDSKEEASSTTAIRAVNSGADNQSLLFRTDNKSTLDIEYDAQFRLSIRDSFIGIRSYLDDQYEPNNSFFSQYLSQMDFGVGTGVTGISMENEISTEFKLKGENDVLWKDLETVDTVTNSVENHFNLFYWNLYTTFEISDQFIASIEYRSYDDDSNDGSTINIDGSSISLSFVYFIY